MGTRVANVKVTTLINRLRDKRAAIEADATAKLGRIEAARAVVLADGWASSQKADWVARLSAALLSGTYTVRYGYELARVAEGAENLGEMPDPDVESAVRKLDSDKERVERSRDQALTAIDSQIDVLSMTVEAETGEGTVEVELGYNPISEFSRLVVSDLQYTDKIAATAPKSGKK